ncbi:MAG: hypothetical protein M3Q03_06075 [Chloroflexota bacterium]|nr:hypothetical protein [Chloroflexota bacterium]
MSRSLWRCRNRACPIPHGAVLGRVTAEDGLVLETGVERFAAYLDTGKVNVWCPACGTVRDFRGRAVSTHSSSR